MRSFGFVEGAPDSLPPIDTTGVEIGLKLKTDVPAGMTALVGARLITMVGDRVVENGVILIERNRIVAAGPIGAISIPENAMTIDVTGKTIMPGIVDVHAHLRNSGNGITPQLNWPYYANLAYGVTTTHDPSSNTEMVFSQSEMVKAGTMVGPRVFSTGTILYGAEYIGLDHDIGSLEPGKLADLVVMNQNPLERIQNTEDIRYVVVNGRIYDALTMDEIGNHPRKRGRLYWENPKTNDAFVWQGSGSPAILCGCANAN